MRVREVRVYSCKHGTAQLRANCACVRRVAFICVPPRSGCRRRGRFCFPRTRSAGAFHLLNHISSSSGSGSRGPAAGCRCGLLRRAAQMTAVFAGCCIINRPPPPLGYRRRASAAAAAASLRLSRTARKENEGSSKRNGSSIATGLWMAGFFSGGSYFLVTARRRWLGMPRPMVIGCRKRGERCLVNLREGVLRVPAKLICTHFADYAPGKQNEDRTGRIVSKLSYGAR